MDFFSSPQGVAIAWICTVASFAYSVFTGSQNKKLKFQLQQFAHHANSNQIKELKSTDADLSSDNVIQDGKKNVYIKNQSGGMKINM